MGQAAQTHSNFGTKLGFGGCSSVLWLMLVASHSELIMTYMYMLIQNILIQNGIYMLIHNDNKITETYT